MSVDQNAAAEKPADDKEQLVEIEVEAEDEAPAKTQTEGEPAAPVEGTDATAKSADGAEDGDPDDDDDDHEDERLSADQREEKKTRRQRAKERRRLAMERNSLALQQAEMRAARAELSSHKTEIRMAAWQAQQESRQIDADAERLQSQYRRLQQAKAEALTNNNGQAAVQADHQLQEVQRKYAELQASKTRVSTSLNDIGGRLKEIETLEAQLAQGGTIQQQETAPDRTNEAVEAPKLNDKGKTYLEGFLAEVPWFKANSKEGASKVIQTIDSAVAAEGYDMNTKEYWDELRSRLKVALPQHFAKKNPAPPVGGARDTMSSNKTKMRIPREAMETMRLAGIIDDSNKVADTKRFNAYLARYKQNTQQAQKRA